VYLGAMRVGELRGSVDLDDDRLQADEVRKVFLLESVSIVGQTELFLRRERNALCGELDLEGAGGERPELTTKYTKHTKKMRRERCALSSGKRTSPASSGHLVVLLAMWTGR
jgi:hypothetical protein